MVFSVIALPLVKITLKDYAAVVVRIFSIFRHLFLLLIYFLTGRNNPITGFRPAATHPSKRFCFSRAYASWSRQSMAGLPQFGPSNVYMVGLFTNFRRSFHQTPVSPGHPPPYELHGRANAAAEY